MKDCPQHELVNLYHLSHCPIKWSIFFKSYILPNEEILNVWSSCKDIPEKMMMSWYGDPSHLQLHEITLNLFCPLAVILADYLERITWKNSCNKDLKFDKTDTNHSAISIIFHLKSKSDGNNACVQLNYQISHHYTWVYMSQSYGNHLLKKMWI